MNKGKGTYTQESKVKARTPEYRKVQREWRKKNYPRLRLRKLEYNKTYQNTIKYRYSMYKSNAKKRGLVFSISINDFERIAKLACTYCGIEASPFNGIDRENSGIGYLLENCVPACTNCNVMKNDSSVDDFLKKCAAIVNYLKL